MLGISPEIVLFGLHRRSQTKQDDTESKLPIGKPSIATGKPGLTVEGS